MKGIVTFAIKSIGDTLTLKTAVVILNWNGKHLMQEFLPALVRCTAGKARLIVADNASTDGSVDWLHANFPDVELICNPTNEGFARGYNTILNQIHSEYFLLLNSDVEVSEGWLEPLEQYLDQNPETAVCQPKIRWQKHRDQFEYAGAAGGFIDRFGYPFCRGRIFGTVETDQGQYNDPTPVFWASGACMMIRSSVFKELGGFDSNFFAHMEEIDLCWRVHNRGYDVVCLPQSVVYHVGGATLPKNNPGKTLLNFRNNLSMLYKNLPANRLLPVILLRLVLDGVASIKFFLEGHRSDCFAVIKAHGQFYKWLLNGTLKRERSKTIITHTTIYPGNIVWAYYILGKKKFTDLDYHPGKQKSKR